MRGKVFGGAKLTAAGAIGANEISVTETADCLRAVTL
jgi:hypothetical protein